MATSPYANAALAAAGFNPSEIEALGEAFTKPIQAPANPALTAPLSNSRSAVESALVIGAYADQSFAYDDYTLGVSGVVSPQRGYLTGVEILAGTSVTLTLQDSPDAASGRTVWSFPATSAPRRWDFSKPIPFHTGLYATIGGTGPSVKFLLGGSE